MRQHRQRRETHGQAYDSVTVTSEATWRVPNSVRHSWEPVVCVALLFVGSLLLGVFKMENFWVCVSVVVFVREVGERRRCVGRDLFGCCLLGLSFAGNLLLGGVQRQTTLLVRCHKPRVSPSLTSGEVEGVDGLQASLLRRVVVTSFQP